MPKWISASNDFSFPIGWVLLRETISAGPLSSKLQASAERAISRPDAQQSGFMKLLLLKPRDYFSFTRRHPTRSIEYQFDVLLTSRRRRSESRRCSDESEP